MISSNKNTQNPDIKRILILGHSGFIGTYLTNFFIKHTNNIEIIGKSLPEIDLTKEKYITYISALFGKETVIIMLSGIKKQFGDSLEIFSQNVKMATNLCRALQDQPVKRLLFFSSADVYGDTVNNVSIDENTPVNPTSFYGMAKYISECLLRKVIKSHKDSTLLILRPPVIYGAGDTSGGYGPSGFVKALLKNGEITLWGDGTERREFVFIDDLVKIVHSLTFQNYEGILNIANGKNYTFRHILEVVSGIVNNKPHIHTRPRTKEKVDQGFNNKALLKLLAKGFSFTPIEEGLKHTISAEQENLILSQTGRGIT